MIGVNLEALSRLDVDHFSLGDVTGLFWCIPRWLARVVLHTGIRRGDFGMNADGTYKFLR